jgi:hypothetical protein
LSYNGLIVFSEKGIEFAISRTKSVKTFIVPNLVNKFRGEKNAIEI